MAIAGGLPEGQDRAALVNKNRGSVPPNATPETIRQWVMALAEEQDCGINHTHLTELLAEREGMILSRHTERRLPCFRFSFHRSV